MTTPTVIEIPPLVAYRLHRFMELGFEFADSLKLANAKGTNGFALYWGDVKDQMRHGATHAQILAIYV